MLRPSRHKYANPAAHQHTTASCSDECQKKTVHHLRPALETVLVYNTTQNTERTSY